MTAEVVNLRRVRKQRARSVAETAAAANRTTFGLSKAVRRRSEAEQALVERRLDGHHLPDDPADRG